MNITIAGTGYVGLSLAVLFAQHNKVIALDVVSEKVDLINKRKSPIQDDYIEKFLKEKPLNLVATTNPEEAYRDADFVVVATPTNYDIQTNQFDTKSVESVIELVTKLNPRAVIVIKSTIPVGFTEEVIKKTHNKNILFSPEFLRESKALYDNLYPSRIIVGSAKEDSFLKREAIKFIDLLKEGAIKKEIESMVIGYKEAEAVKLFSNTFLAMRVSYFNELDTYAEMNGLNTNEIIEGVCLDPRIGNFYNNPSFGYGGYCLPKDTKQLLANFKDLPQALIRAIVEANEIRKDFISKRIAKLLSDKSDTQTIIGIYRLTMKSSSDNFRDSAIQDIIKHLNDMGKKIVIYEPTITDSDSFNNIELINDLEKFKSESSLIIANRLDASIQDVMDKVYCRDIYQRD